MDVLKRSRECCNRLMWARIWVALVGDGCGLSYPDRGRVGHSFSLGVGCTKRVSTPRGLVAGNPCRGRAPDDECTDSRWAPGASTEGEEHDHISVFFIAVDRHPKSEVRGQRGRSTR